MTGWGDRARSSRSPPKPGAQMTLPVSPGLWPGSAATNTPSGRRVYMHDAIMGLDTLEDELWN